MNEHNTTTKNPLLYHPMINVVSTPIRLAIFILLTGVALFMLSLAMPQYNATGIEQQLNELSINNDPANQEHYYKIRTEASTNKYLYADLGSGLIVFSIALFVFFSVQGVNSFSKFRKTASREKGRIFVLANFGILLLIPGTAWYYGLRNVRGEYPPWADTIAIPIMEQSIGILIMLIPLNIYLLFASFRSRHPALIFSRRMDNSVRSVLWELFFGIPILLATVCTVLSIIGGDHFLIIVSMIMVHVILSLRAGKLGIEAIDIDEITPATTYEEVIQKVDVLLGELKSKINENTIVKLTKFESIDDLLNTLEDYKVRIHQQDVSVFTEIDLEFAESGSFRKIAMLNDWGKSFFTLAGRYEFLHTAVKQKRSTVLPSGLEL